LQHAGKELRLERNADGPLAGDIDQRKRHLDFANANLFAEEVETLVTQGPTPIRWFVLDTEAMVDIDTTGAEALHQVLQLLASRDVTFALARAKPQLPSLLQRYQLLELTGAVDADRQVAPSPRGFRARYARSPKRDSLWQPAWRTHPPHDPVHHESGAGRRSQAPRPNRHVNPTPIQ
jgi:anti-anti-sigma regulatory factor